MVHKIHGSVRCDTAVSVWYIFNTAKRKIFSNVLFIKTKCFTLNNDGT